MIRSQQAMMLDSAKSFEALVKDSKNKDGSGTVVTWDDPDELERYIRKLQEAANKIMAENRRLRKQHFVVCEKVRVLFLYID